MSNHSLFRMIKHLFYLLVIFTGLVLFTYLSNIAYLTVDMNSDTEGQIQIFWTEGAKPYDENRSSILPVKQGQHNYGFFLHKFSQASRLRIDPIGSKSHLKLFSINIYSSQYQSILISRLSDILHQNQIRLNKDLDKNYIAIQSIGTDPFFETKFSVTRYDFKYIFVIIILLLLSGAILKWTPSTFTLIRIIGLSVVVLSFQLAWQSKYNSHPDEKAHIESIKYYKTYWDPPVVGDSRAINAYQYPWGISRLDNLGISYFFAGKFMRIIEYFIFDEVFNARSFNLLLLTGLFLYCINKQLSLFLTPLLCTPQIWYLFSYANRGSFALLISVFLAWQLAHKNSSLHRFLISDKVFDNWKFILLPGLLLGVLLIEQTNYLIFILFLFAILFWELFFIVKQKKIFAYKCVLLIFLAASLCIARYAIDVSINGFNKYEQQVAYAEAHAAPAFKPSIAGTNQSYPGLRLNQKGVGLVEIFKQGFDWHIITFKSFTGFYGYYAQESPRWYYLCTLVLYAMILACILVGALRINTLQIYSLLAISFVFIMGGLAISILYSWLYDFQPQGRYIFPIIPIALVYLWKTFPLLDQPEKLLIISCSACLIALSLYSFSTIALNHTTY